MFQLSKQGAVAVVSGSEPIKHEQVAELASAIDRVVQGGQPMAVLDLQRTPLIDSAGLESLLDAQDAVERRGGTLKMAAPNELIRDILRVSGVAERFEIFSDVKTAVGSFAR